MFSPFINKRAFLALVFLTLAALAGNYFTLDLFWGISFLFGSIASLVVLYLFGTPWGVLVTLISSIQTIVLWHHPYAAILLGLEILFIGLFRRQPSNILLVDILYWLIIGMPLGWLFYALVLNLNNTQVLLLLLKKAVNGIANALIANLIITYLPLNKWLHRPQADKKISLQSNILNLLICCLFLPLLVLTLLDSNRVVNHLVSDIQADLELTSSFLSTELQAWHQAHLDRFNKLAQIAVKSNVKSSANLQLSTDLMQQLFPDSYSISIENNLGNQVAFSGNNQNKIIGNSDNKLLIEKAKNTLKPILSSAISDSSLPDSIVNLIVPIVRNKEFLGTVNSNLDLRYFSQLLKINNSNKSWQFTILDSQQRIIASTGTEIETSFARRQEGEFRYINSTMYNWLPSKPNLTPINRWQQSLYGQKISINDTIPWSIVVELPAKSYINYLNSLYINNFGIVLIVGVLAIESAIIVSRKISKPLAKLTDLTNNLPHKLTTREDIEWFYSPIIEIDSLINNFRLMAIALNNKFTEIQNINKSLEEQVQERTKVALRVKMNLINVINQHQQTEVALHETEARYWDLFENANDLIQSVTPEGKFIYVNRAWREALGYNQTEIDNISMLDIIDCDSHAHCIEVFEQVMSGEKIDKVETTFITKFGRKLIVEGSVNCKIVHGKPVSTRSIFRDITERKQAEAEIQHALQKERELGELKSRFINTASHEFRTPLTIILMSARLLEQFNQQASEQQKNLYFERIKAAIKRMNELLNDVLLVGKSESGKTELNSTRLALIKFCQQLIEETQMSTGSHHIINFISQGDDTSAYLDEKLLRHILSNLLSNAIKYSPQGEEVNFKLTCETNQATFEIKDSGIGIPVKDIEQLFNSFHRGSNVKSIPGTGLGLSIVKQYVELHGGTITVNSELGVGTTFTVVLPFIYNHQFHKN
ncbi:sensor histidine kinase [Synechocystis sp. PCC 7509]|uniref:sensor histidine kinase n=1 Tax=Synechocystis sp. PCC 7509 TaxID=927677 RepID=UPI0002ABDF0F|nr:ATP-binding protein [Synechocystis sp. PCC 7509]